MTIESFLFQTGSYFSSDITVWENKLTKEVSLLYLFFIVTIETCFGIHSHTKIQYERFAR
jgi:hypothetical protein